MRWKVGLLSIGVALLSVPGTAFGASATLFSEPGDYIGGGRQAVFDTRVGDRVSATVSAGYLRVSVGGGPYDERYNLTFAAPDGPVRPGVYPQAQRALFRQPGHPGIDVSADARSCYAIRGGFEVKELTTRPDGSVERAWIIYEQHCNGAALFGEVRIGSAGPSPSSLVRWPTRDLGAGGHTVPVVVNAGATITDVRIEGEARADFSVREDKCTGLASPCEVWVRFVPRAPGTRVADLQVKDASGASSNVPLQGFSYGGTTGLTMHSEPGDFIGQGKSWSYGPGPGFSVHGSGSFMDASINDANGDWWELEFRPPAGGTLAPGTYTGATRQVPGDGGAGLSVRGEGRGCNRLSGNFTVHELVLNGSDVRSLSISFEQHCEQGTPALRGTLNYRAGDQTPLAPWMVASTTPWPEPTPTPTSTPTAPRTTTPTVTPEADPRPITPPWSAVPTPDATPTPSPSAADPALAIRRDRVAASSLALIKTVGKLRGGRVKPARSAATRLMTDLRQYRNALRASKAQDGATVALRAVDRQIAAVHELRRALARYAAGRGRTAGARAVAKAARKLTEAQRATASEDR